MGKTLLLADDSVTIQKVVGISFASEDIAIKTVDNGDDAIARARELKPDVILADVVMPGKSGYEVCEAVKADPELRHIPVLLLTGTFEAFDEDRAAIAGASGHVAKPFEAQTLVERVKTLLAQAPTVAAVAPAPQPQPAAPAPAPAQPAAAEDNAFDFFDDAIPESEPAARADLDMDTSGDAFAFDEDEFGTTADPVAETPAMPDPPAAHTVAILPDDVDDAPEAPSFADSGLPPLRPPSAEPRPAPPVQPSASSVGGEGFDFEFESVSSAPAEPLDGDASEGLAESMLLDPAGDSAYDVSSSQLGDLSAAPEASSTPEPEPIAATQLLGVTPPPVPGPAGPVVPPPVPGPAGPVVPPPVPAMDDDEDPVMEMDAIAADPLDGGDEMPSAAFVEEVPTGAPQRAGDASPIVSPPQAPRPDASAPDRGIAVEDAPAAPESRARVADDALAQIAPALREQLHETLEKIAWEAFGQVTETVVAQTVERLEKIAWEVVPKLAETLIAEEIRKLKEES